MFALKKINLTMGRPRKTKSDDTTNLLPEDHVENDSDMDEILVNTLTESLEKFTSDIEKNLKKDSPILARFSSNPLKCIFEMLVTINESIQKQNDYFEARVNKLESTLELRKKDDKVLEERIEKLEMAERANKAILTCESLVSSSKNIYNETRQLLSKELGLVEDCTKTIRVNKLGQNGKSLLLTFPNIEAKIETYRRITERRKNLVATDRKPPIFMNDFLTPSRARLFKEIRKLKEDSGGIYSVFSYNGNICVKVQRDDRMKIVYSLDQCKQLLHI